MRLRPSTLPEGYSLSAIFEQRLSGTAGHSVFYGLPDTGLGPSSQILVSVSTGPELGGFERVASVHLNGYGTDTEVDVNGAQAISSTLAPVIAWVAEDDTRVSVSAGDDVSREELLTAARGLDLTKDGPRIGDEALPAGAELLDEQLSHEFDQLQASMRFSRPTDQGGSRSLTLFIDGPLASYDSPDATPDDANSAGATRWDRASLDPAQYGYVVWWSEGDNVSASVIASEIPESQLKEFVNGLEVVSEEDWQMFLKLSFPRGTPTPDTGSHRIENIVVLAAPDDNVWTWLERGHHLGTFLCTTRNPDPTRMSEYVLMLPDFQIGSGFDEIEALAEEQRRFPCEP
jgi:hypothetical protein